MRRRLIQVVGLSMFVVLAQAAVESVVWVRRPPRQAPASRAQLIAALKSADKLLVEADHE